MGLLTFAAAAVAAKAAASIHSDFKTHFQHCKTARAGAWVCTAVQSRLLLVNVVHTVKPVPDVLTKAAAVVAALEVTAVSAAGLTLGLAATSAPVAPVFVDCTVGLNLAGLKGNCDSCAEVGIAAAAVDAAAAAYDSSFSFSDLA